MGYRNCFIQIDILGMNPFQKSYSHEIITFRGDFSSTIKAGRTRWVLRWYQLT